MVGLADKKKTPVQNPILTVKYGGGSFIVWGYFVPTGPGALVKANCIIKVTQYSGPHLYRCVRTHTKYRL